jgi:ankyrin repeat protein
MLCRNNVDYDILEEAVRGHDSVFISTILDHGVDINMTGSYCNGNSLLHESVRRGKSTLTEILIKAGADVNKRNNDGDTPLSLDSSDTGTKKCIELLILNGADIDNENIYGHTALTYSIYKNRFNLAEFLIKLGANTNKISGLKNRGKGIEMTPLFYALETQNFEVIELLLKNGADANMTCRRITPLEVNFEQFVFAQESKKKLHVSELLLKYGADPNIFGATMFGCDSLLAQSFYWGYTESTKLYIRYVLQIIFVIISLI